MRWKEYQRYADHRVLIKPLYKESMIIWCYKTFLSFIFCNLFQENASERARKIFAELDINGDGTLDADEFVKGCMEDKDLLQTLNGGGDMGARDG